MNWQRLKGKFIVLDGPDGAGKSTQVRLLEAFLVEKGVLATVVRDPGGTSIGEQIRAILLDHRSQGMSVRCETLLYMASRAQLYEERIAPAITSYQCVLCDRWVSSTYAYQAVAGKIGADKVLQIAEVSLERTWPDLTIILDLPSDVGLGRLPNQPDRMEAKGLEFHYLVRQAFIELAQRRGDVKLVDARGSVSEVQQRIEEVLTDYVAG